MKYETEAACVYWLSCLDTTKLTSYQMDTFFSQLQVFMRNKFATHWYESNPLQGQAFRSMVCDIQRSDIDHLLLDASAAAGFSFTQMLKETKGSRMWIDPGEVEVENIQGQKKRIQLFPERTEERLPQEPLYYYSQFEDTSSSQFYRSQTNPYEQQQQYSEFYAPNTIQESYNDGNSNWSYMYPDQQGYEHPSSTPNLFSVIA